MNRTVEVTIDNLGRLVIPEVVIVTLNLRDIRRISPEMADIIVMP